MDWIVYCTSCKKEIDRMKNGPMADAYARLHIEQTGHKVIVGYDPDSSNQPTEAKELH